jgi:hypothetical protein
MGGSLCLFAFVLQDVRNNRVHRNPPSGSDATWIREIRFSQMSWGTQNDFIGTGSPTPRRIYSFGQVKIPLLLTLDTFDGTVRDFRIRVAVQRYARRTSVTVVAHTLAAAGLIKYARGKIQILNADALRESACECYDTVNRHYVRLLDIEIGSKN